MVLYGVNDGKKNNDTPAQPQSERRNGLLPSAIRHRQWEPPGIRMRGGEIPVRWH
ncbi:MAG: hypothetical protein LBI03_00545 [Clostridiales bacterium]|nr:hypothetical protein [Clostridiales bacterium]